MMRIIGSGESVRTWCPFHKWQYSTVHYCYHCFPGLNYTDW